MSNSMFKAGDVVLGAFVTKDGTVLNHYSVVLMANQSGVLLAYTTSLKEASRSPQVFTAADMQLANWTKPCRWDASSVCVVPNARVRKVGTITKATLANIMASYQKAARTRALTTAMLTEHGEVVAA